MQARDYWSREALLAFRLRHKLKAWELAAILGTTSEVVSRWEHGHSAVSPFYAGKLDALMEALESDTARKGRRGSSSRRKMGRR